MSLQIIRAQDVLDRLDAFSAIIDARSEDEYALDHLPGAVNWPTLSNEERRIVGTTYKQISSFEARKRGAAKSGRVVKSASAKSSERPAAASKKTARKKR